MRSGFLLVVHVTSAQVPFPRKAHALRLSDDEVKALEEVGKHLLNPIVMLGAPSLAVGRGISMKDICQLHERDPHGTPRVDIQKAFNEHKSPFTWTDLQELLRQLPVPDFFEALDDLRQKGLIDETKFSYGRAACDYLADQRYSGPKALDIPLYESIYDAVWMLDCSKEDLQGHIFRGQSNANWRLEIGRAHV